MVKQGCLSQTHAGWARSLAVPDMLHNGTQDDLLNDFSWHQGLADSSPDPPSSSSYRCASHLPTSDTWVFPIDQDRWQMIGSVSVSSSVSSLSTLGQIPSGHMDLCRSKWHSSLLNIPS